MGLPDRSNVRLSFPPPGPRAWVRVGAAATEATVCCNGQVVGRHLGAWTPFEFEITRWLVDGTNEVEVRCRHRDHATAGFLPAVGAGWCGARDVEIRTGPTVPRAAAAQRSAVSGRRLLVDGEPFRVRGILHWGLYPELGRPWPSEAQMRREITELSAMGFNLVKLCLWIPPERYYELCDELSMLVWQEYPVWDRPLDNPALLGEYEEFLRLDGPHACVILRSLTCENDRIDPGLAGAILDLGRRLVPGALFVDNSAWRCAQRGDFHDEHVYLHNVQWRYYGARMSGSLRKPLLLGESMAVDSVDETSHRAALEVRRHQIEVLERDLPDAGYVVTALRDLKETPLGIYTHTGQPKYAPEQWSWHGAGRPPRKVPELSGPVIGPRKGEWKCAESTWWSPVVKVLDLGLPRDLVEREACFELLSGRVLTHAAGTRVLVEMWDVHSGERHRHPLVVEFETEGERRVVSAFRTDTDAGRQLEAILDARTGPAPEIGPLFGDAIVLERWVMDGSVEVACDTPLVNRGRNIFEGWAIFETTFDWPGGRRILRCEAVGDYYEVSVDGRVLGEAGNPTGTWDGTRDVPREFPVELEPGRHAIRFRVRDWRAAGGMVGPVFFATDPGQRVFRGTGTGERVPRPLGETRDDDNVSQHRRSRSRLAIRAGSWAK